MKINKHLVSRYWLLWVESTSWVLWVESSYWLLWVESNVWLLWMESSCCGWSLFAGCLRGSQFVLQSDFSHQTERER